MGGELDPLIHATTRLRIMVALTTLPAGERVTFPALQKLLDLTSGNLTTHLSKLEGAGYVSVTKIFRRRTPVTYLRVTSTGRRAFDEYRTALHQILPPRT